MVETKPDKRTEFRTSVKAVWLGKLAGWFTRFLSMTLRIKIVDRCGITRRKAGGGPVAATGTALF